MPLYQFRCRKCSHEFEELQSMTEGTVNDCPKCKQKSVDRIIGHFNIGGLTETAFLRSTRCNGSSLDRISDPIRRRALLEQAKKAGVSTYGKEYHHELAISHNDPEAWCGSMDDIQRLCKKRNWKFGIKDGNIDVGIPSEDVGPFKKKAKGKE